jgi:hypothetical protein
MRANQAQIAATFRFSATFTAHHYFFRFHICASLHKLGTSLRRHPEVFSFITPFAFPLHSTSFSLFPLVSIVILLSYFVLFIVLSFPFRLSWFLYLILHICMYTRPFHRFYRRDFVPPSFSHLARTRRTRISFPFNLRTSRNTPQHPSHTHSFLEPDSHPSRTLTPATAVVCFVLGTASGVPAHQR